MTNISQGKKIAVAAIAIFLISFSMLLFFLKDFEPKGIDAHTDVLQASNESHVVEPEGIEESHEDLPEYLEHLNDEHVDDLDDPLFVTNPEGVIQYGNDEFCTIIESKCEGIEGNLIFDYVNTKDISDLAAAHGKLVHDGEETDGLGPFRMLQGKTEVFLLFTAEPLIDDDDKVSHIIYRINDITEKVQEMNGENTKKLDTEKIEESPDDAIKKDDTWIEHLYPKSEELKDDVERLMVNKTV
ncbi:PAS domain-containing protein [Candidatus Peregrinibacteria bacterium]|jgi:PAS domain S-box-containing protein|nr:PAS domain-containing protein [Candidatus Peregrinibacteria bacterium]MBT7736227.1 PAS domain-containing protein [Candidatus Peregrinibacteria bacterium]